MISPHREKAIELRKNGASYSEILKEIPIAKSTLSLWLHSVGLSKEQKQRLTAKKLESALRGSQARKAKRIALVQSIYNETDKDIGVISRRDLWLIGIMLYWAEGSKEKERYPGSGIKFSNSDPFMIKLFIDWLHKIAQIPKGDIYYELYIHETAKQRLTEAINRWSIVLGIPKEDFNRVYFKKGNPKTNRKNIYDEYCGLLTVRVRRSSTLNRKIAGWVRGVIKYSRNWGVV